MVEGTDKRSCHRFEVPEATAKYKKRGLLVFVRALSKAFPVINLSKGGVSFACEEPLSKGQNVVVELLMPNHEPMVFHAEVRWQARSRQTGGMAIGVAFVPFGERSGLNPLENLEALRELDATYGASQKAKKRE